MECRTEYEARLQARQRTRDALRRQDGRAVMLRAAAFGFGLLVAWAALARGGAFWLFLLIPIGLFFGTVVYHWWIKRELLTTARAIDYYRRCLDRLDGKWAGAGPDGAEFADALHPYSGDLDIFGQGSLFQLLNSPVTPAGAKTLAAWLAPNADEALPPQQVVIDRQDAVRCLRDQLDLRERLAIIGPATQSQQEALELKKWLTNPGGLTAPWIAVVGSVLGVLGVLALGDYLVRLVNGDPTNFGALLRLILVVFVQQGFLYGFRATLTNITRHSERAVIALRHLTRVVSALETVRDDAPTIQRLRKELAIDGAPASLRIRRLGRLVSQFDNLRRNKFTAPLAVITMAGLHFATAIDRWRTSDGPHIGRWFDAAGELEALLAFSRLHFENPTYCFPQVVEGAPRFTAKGLSHPLLPRASAVANDVAIGDDCRLLIISGSNMSGKSTLMRSVGVNTALAWAGAPVFASELTLSRLQATAAMRVQDSLQTGTSHFLAELKRIQLVVGLADSHANQSQTVLFLLDEILHGTNSHDRLVGAHGVIKRLLESGAVGLVTTHDLALSEIAGQLDHPAKNVHFRDESVDGEMTFDYKMRAGVVPKSNALTLMRLLGLDV